MKRQHAPSVPTSDSLQKTSRTTSAARIIEEMRRGANLHVYFERGRTLYQLSTRGISIQPATAQAVIHNANVVAVGDCLFGDAITASQTYRFVCNQGEAT